MDIKQIKNPTYMSNTYILDIDSENVVLFDAGVPTDMIDDYIDGKNVIALFITHAHFDHIIYIDEYVDRYHIPTIYCHPNAIEKLTDPTMNLSHDFIDNDIIIKSTNITPVNDNDDIYNIHCIYLPGHSECSVGYVYGDCIVSGDVLFHNAVGRTDLADGDNMKLRKSIRKIRRYTDINVCAGHGRTFHHASIQ